MGRGLPGTATKSRLVAIHPAPFEDKSGTAVSASADTAAQIRPAKAADRKNISRVKAAIARLPCFSSRLLLRRSRAKDDGKIIAPRNQLTSGRVAQSLMDVHCRRWIAS